MHTPALLLGLMVLLPAALISAESTDQTSLAPSGKDNKALTGPSIKDAEPASIRDRMARKVFVDVQQVTAREAAGHLGTLAAATIIVHPKFFTENSKVTLKPQTE